MSDRRKRVARDFRIVQGLFAAILLGLAYWLFATPGVGIWRWVFGPVLALVGAFAVIDVFNGPFGKGQKRH